MQHRAIRALAATVLASIVLGACAVDDSALLGSADIDEASESVDSASATDASATDASATDASGTDSASTADGATTDSVETEEALKSAEPIAATIWVSDPNCETFVEESASVSANYTARDLVDGVLAASWAGADPAIVDVVVAIDPETAIAEVDLTQAPTSSRQLQSLSSCEMHVLFGAIEQTLVRDPKLGIDAVEFFIG